MDASSLGLNEIVVSASRKKEKITDAPSVVSVVNQQTIRRRVGVLDFNRLASLAKGVDVTYYGLQGAQINARGFDGAYSTRFRQFADGVYEVFAVLEKRIVDYDGHIKRLFRSLSEIRINSPITKESYLYIIRKLIKKNNLVNGLIYLQVTRGVAERDFKFPEKAKPSLVITAKKYP